MKKGFNKKAFEYGLEVLILLIFTIAFFVIFWLFANGAGKGALVYEEVYAKQIALFIDNAKPEMVILLNMGKAAELARENNRDLGSIIRLDKNENRVIVGIGAAGGHSYQYFSDYDIELNFNKDREELSIIIK